MLVSPRNAALLQQSLQNPMYYLEVALPRRVVPARPALHSHSQSHVAAPPSVPRLETQSKKAGQRGPSVFKTRLPAHSYTCIVHPTRISSLSIIPACHDHMWSLVDGHVFLPRMSRFHMGATRSLRGPN